VKGDSYVVESDIHYPTDTGLLWDSARKCLDIMGYLSAEHGFCGWRKAGDWRKRLKSAERAVSQAFRCRGAGKEPRVERAARHYTALANALKVKVAAALPDVELFLRVTRVAEKYKLLPYYHGMLAKHLDIVGRRLLEGEKIPQSEKLFSIFQPMVEWISKGKAGKRVEFGHKVLIATDQHGLILHHQVVQKTDDRDLAVPLAEALAAKYKLSSLSLDKGFYSKANKDAIVKLVPRLVMPKKGSLTAADREEEGGKQFKELKNRHSAVESNINQLENNGLGKCRDKGFKAFTRYTALGVLSYNLHRVGSALLAAARKRRAEEQLRPLQEAA
jgi:transposase, IS5 family